VAKTPCDIFKVNVAEWHRLVPGHFTKSLVENFKKRHPQDLQRAHDVLKKSLEADRKMKGPAFKKIEVRAFEDSPFLKRKVLPADTPVRALSEMHLNVGEILKKIGNRNFQNGCSKR